MTQLETIVKQVEFSSVEDFTLNSANYWTHFSSNYPAGLAHRIRPHFLRFQNTYPEMERKLTLETGDALEIQMKTGDRNGVLSFPKELQTKLWDSYKLMSQFVYIDDPFITRTPDGQPDKWRLCR